MDLAVFKENLPAILGLIYALLNLANALVKNPEAKSAIGKLVDALSILTRSGAAGTLKAPLQPSRAHANGVAPKSPPNLKALVALPLAFVVGLSGCACFRPSSDEYNSKKCVVARQVVDYTKDSLLALLPLVPGIAVALISGQSIDWAAVGQGAQDKGLANAACILAAIRVDFGQPRPSEMASVIPDMPPELQVELAARAGAELERLAAQHYGGSVDVRLPEARGRRALVRVRAAR